MASLKDKVVIVTGASSGIGAATCIHLSQYGSKLVLAARNMDNLTKISSLCREAGLEQDKMLLIQCDVTKEEDLTRLVEQTISKFGEIHVLVNNAGSGLYKTSMETSPEEFDRLVNLNLKSPLRLCQLCVPYLTKTKGNIVNISSISAKNAFPGCSVYCATKAGLDMLTKCMALELAPKKIRVNSVNPGVIITNFQTAAGMSDERYKSYIEHQKDTQPFSGAIEAEEVAKAIKFLASDEASTVTGQILFVDGGRSVLAPT